MQLQVSGRNLDITAPIREYAERKLARIERHLTEDTRVDLELAKERAWLEAAMGQRYVKGLVRRAPPPACRRRCARTG